MAGERAAGGSGQPSMDVGIDEELRRAVGSANALAYFIVFNGEYPQRVYVITRSTMLIGRDDDTDLQIPDASVSAHHARVSSRGAGFEIEDLSSTNGVFLSGERVKRSPLRNGDRVTVGAVDLMFLLERPTSATIRLPDMWRRPPVAALSAAGPGAVAPALPPRRASGDDEDEQSFDDLIRKLAAVYGLVRNEMRRIVLLTFLGAAVGLASVPLRPPPATAAAEVKLLPRPTFVSDSREERFQNADEGTTAFVKGAERILTQPDFVRATLLHLTGLAPDQRRVMAVVTGLKVEETGDHMFRVTYKDQAHSDVSPMEFLSEHVRVYVQAEISKSVREVNAKVAFLGDQLKTVEADLNRIGADRAGFRELNVDRLPEDAALTSSSRHSMETRRADLISEIHRLEGDLKAEQFQLSKDSPVARTRFQWSETYRQSLVEVNRKLSEAYARGLTDGHPEVKQLKDERQRIQALAKEELQSSTSNLVREGDPNYQQARSRVEKLRADLGAARANLAETDRTLGRLRQVEKDLPRVEQQLSDLDHRQTATKLLHGELFSKLKQAEIQLNLEKVSAESRFDVSPVVLDKPRRVVTVVQRGGIGVFAGLVIAMLLIALREGRRIVSNALASGPADSTLLRPGERRDPPA
jgi:pSer/pThr/pTyr-binding forkhead associated (FHA) protein